MLKRKRQTKKENPFLKAANQPQRTKLNERKKTQLATVAERLRRYREGRRVDGE